MPTLHRRSFSEIHLGAAVVDCENDIPEEPAKLHVVNFNSKGTKGAKASRNVLNDVKKKAGELPPPQSPQGKFINLLGGGLAGAAQPVTNNALPKTSDLDRLVAVHTRNAKGGR